MPLPKDITSLIPSETIQRAYDDAMSGPMKQIGELGVEAAKTARLVLFPLKLGASLHDRMVPMFERIAQRVPEERRIEAPSELVGPALERMRYLDNESNLWRMFEEVITKSVDSATASSIHPSFSFIISQLSRDEAWILYKLRDKIYTFELFVGRDERTGKWEVPEMEATTFPIAELYYPDQVILYASHLESLNLTRTIPTEQWPSQGGETGAAGVEQVHEINLTDFGKLFVAACVPQEGF